MAQSFVYVAAPMTITNYHCETGPTIRASNCKVTPIRRQVFTLITGGQSYLVDWIDGAIHRDANGINSVLISRDGNIYVFTATTHWEFMGWLSNCQRKGAL